MNAYLHPNPGRLGRCVASLVNSPRLARLRRAVLSRLPFVQMESDVADVVYLTWLVDAEAARRLLPPGLRLWERCGKTPFTVLTYRHGHFGPAFMGPLRRLMPSPLQSNWRFYLDESPQAAHAARTVFFLKNIMGSLPYAVGTRLFSDVMATHLPRRFVHQVDGHAIDTRIAPGTGSSPSLQCQVAISDRARLPEGFSAIFPSWDAAVSFLAEQDAAIAIDDRSGKLALSEISLPVDTQTLHPLVVSGGPVVCSLLDRLPGAIGPFCFGMPRVKFKVLSERLL